jgi:activator of HSP90 ATPase
MINAVFKIAALIAATSFLQSSALAQDTQDTLTQHPSSVGPLKSITIHQEVDFKASPERLYEALLDTKQFSAFAAGSAEFSAKSAKIDRAVGGAFSLFDGHIIGRNVELVPNQRIVQAWRVVDWPAGVYSIVKFELKSQGSGTHLVFDHTGFPEKWRDHLATGWQRHYWDLLTKYLH